MKHIKYNTPKNKVQSVKNELKYRINKSDNLQLFHIQKSFSYLSIFKNDDDEDCDSLYELILFKLKRMQSALKQNKFCCYEMYCKSLDLCIGCFEIYLHNDNIDISIINTKNMSAQYKSYFENIKDTKITIHNFTTDVYKTAMQQYYKAKALKVAWHLLENKSGYWWV